MGPKTFAEEAAGLINTSPYSLDRDSELNKRFVASMRKHFGRNPPLKS